MSTRSKYVQTRHQVSRRQRSRAMMEALEERRLFSMLGVTLSTTPLIAFGGPTLAYSSTTNDLSTTSSLTIALPGGTISPPGTLVMDIKVDNTGALTGTATPTDLVVTDTTGTLLTGQVNGFGYQFIDANDAAFDFTFHVTGGSLASSFINQDIGMVIQADISTFTGSFTSGFQTDVKGTLGPVPQKGGGAPLVITGHKFQDLTGNGFSADDAGLGGFTINLYADSNNSGSLDSGDSLVASQVTAADGSYAFTGLAAGTYFVQEVNQPGYTETGPASGVYTINGLPGSVNTGVDFDNFKNICISGTKFKDLTGNSFSADDKPLAGVTIDLFKNGSATPVATTVTAADGSYSFANLGPGTYFVQEEVPAGWTQTGGTAGYTINATSGTNSKNNNFDDFLPASISGHKFLDASGNGLSSDDTGLGGFTIQLYADTNNSGALDTGDKLVATTVTAAGTGAYAFNNLPAGKYFLKEVNQTGYVETGPASGTYTVNLGAGQNLGNFDFDNFKTDDCVVSCIHYVINGCYTVDSLEGNTSPGDTVKAIFTIPEGETITLVSYTAPGSSFDANNAYQQQIYDIDTGVFTQAGTYCLTVTIPNCYYQIDLVCGLAIDHFGPAGSNVFYSAQDRLHDHDNGGCSPCCSILNGKSTLAGTVYSDCDNDGKKDAGESGIPGATVILTGTTNGGTSVSVTTTTDLYGNYKFFNLPAGTYKVTEKTPAGFYDGIDSAGSAGGTVGNDVISNIVIGSNVNAVNYNFGELDGSNLSGKVYADKDKDGHVDSGEYGISGVKMTLTGTNDLGQAICITTYTDCNGNYCFNNLRAGSYTITESQPYGWTTTKDTVGTDGGLVSGDKITNIVVTWCDDGSGYNFGEYKPYC